LALVNKTVDIEIIDDRKTLSNLWQSLAP